MAADPGMQDARELTRGVVAHDQTHVVATLLECRRLQLRMFDDRAPERPRERDDDPDLHGVFRKTGDPLARSLRSHRIPEGDRFAAASLRTFIVVVRKSGDPLAASPGNIGPSLVPPS